VLVGGAFNEPLALQGIEPVNGGFVRGDLAVSLDFADQGGLAVFTEVALDEREHGLLLFGKGKPCHAGTGVETTGDTKD
jgi:hypothetical protein